MVSWAAAEGLAARIDDPGPYVAILPISLGLWKLLWPGSTQQQTRRAGGVLAGTLMFLLLTGDTFSLFALLLADSMAILRPVVLIGAISSAAGLGLLAARLQSRASLAAWMDRLALFVMISVGLYIFLDSGTDLFQ